MCIYIYIRHRACKAHRACLIQWHSLQAYEEEGGRRASSLGASTPIRNLPDFSCDPFNIALVFDLVLFKDFDGNFFTSNKMSTQPDFSKGSLSKRTT